MDKTYARDIMSTDVITLREGDTLEEALKALINHRITGVLIVDDRSRVLGVCSEYDLIRQISKCAQSRKLCSQMFRQKIEYSKNPDTVRDDTTLDELTRRFVDAKFRRVPVLDKHGKLAGIITRRDLMRLFYYRAKLSG